MIERVLESELFYPEYNAHIQYCPPHEPTFNIEMGSIVDDLYNNISIGKISISGYTAAYVDLDFGNINIPIMDFGVGRDLQNWAQLPMQTPSGKFIDCREYSFVVERETVEQVFDFMTDNTNLFSQLIRIKIFPDSIQGYLCTASVPRCVYVTSCIRGDEQILPELITTTNQDVILYTKDTDSFQQLISTRDSSFSKECMIDVFSFPKWTTSDIPYVENVQDTPIVSKTITYRLAEKKSIIYSHDLAKVMSVYGNYKDYSPIPPNSPQFSPDDIATVKIIPTGETAPFTTNLATGSLHSIVDIYSNYTHMHIGSNGVPLPRDDSGGERVPMSLVIVTLSQEKTRSLLPPTLEQSTVLCTTTSGLALSLEELPPSPLPLGACVKVDTSDCVAELDTLRPNGVEYIDGNVVCRGGYVFGFVGVTKEDSPLVLEHPLEGEFAQYPDRIFQSTFRGGGEGAYVVYPGGSLSPQSRVVLPVAHPRGQVPVAVDGFLLENGRVGEFYPILPMCPPPHPGANATENCSLLGEKECPGGLRCGILPYDVRYTGQAGLIWATESESINSEVRKAHIGYMGDTSTANLPFSWPVTKLLMSAGMTRRGISLGTSLFLGINPYYIRKSGGSWEFDYLYNSGLVEPVCTTSTNFGGYKAIITDVFSGMVAMGMVTSSSSTDMSMLPQVESVTFEQIKRFVGTKENLTSFTGEEVTWEGEFLWVVSVTTVEDSTTMPPKIPMLQDIYLHTQEKSSTLVEKSCSFRGVTPYTGADRYQVDVATIQASVRRLHATHPDMVSLQHGKTVATKVCSGNCDPPLWKTSTTVLMAPLTPECSNVTSFHKTRASVHHSFHSPASNEYYSNVTNITHMVFISDATSVTQPYVTLGSIKVTPETPTLQIDVLGNVSTTLSTQLTNDVPVGPSVINTNLPSVEEGNTVSVELAEVESDTQTFIHGLSLKNCNRSFNTFEDLASLSYGIPPNGGTTLPAHYQGTIDPEHPFVSATGNVGECLTSYRIQDVYALSGYTGQFMVSTTKTSVFTLPHDGVTPFSELGYMVACLIPRSIMSDSRIRTSFTGSTVDLSTTDRTCTSPVTPCSPGEITIHMASGDPQTKAIISEKMCIDFTVKNSHFDVSQYGRNCRRDNGVDVPTCNTTTCPNKGICNRSLTMKAMETSYGNGIHFTIDTDSYPSTGKDLMTLSTLKLDIGMFSHIGARVTIKTFIYSGVQDLLSGRRTGEVKVEKSTPVPEPQDKKVPLSETTTGIATAVTTLPDCQDRYHGFSNYQTIPVNTTDSQVFCAPVVCSSVYTNFEEDKVTIGCVSSLYHDTTPRPADDESSDTFASIVSICVSILSVFVMFFMVGKK